LITTKEELMRNLTLILLVLMASVVALPVFAAAAPPGVDLQAKFETGQIHRFDYEIRSTQNISAFGSDQTTESKMDARIELEVLDEEPAGGGHVIGLTYRRLSISFEGGQVPGAFDSQNPPSTDAGNVYAEICRPLLDEQIRLIVDERGTIKAVEGLEQVAPEGLAGVLFGELFSEAAAKAMYQPVIKVLDEDDRTRRRPSDEWTIKRPAVASLGVPESEVSLRMLTGDSPRDIAEIELTGKPSATMPADAAVLPNIETKKAELTGSLRWNGALGILESMHTEAVTQMESTAQGITITVDTASATTIKRVR
jgi:hypothetical protein